MDHIIKTDVGVVRKENQDRAAFFQKGDVSLAILCDGMGGHTGGSFASSITINTFEREFTRNNVNRDNVSKWFTKTLRVAIDAMRKKAGEDAKLLDMGTTLTAACIFKDDIIVFNIGDSRTYVYTTSLEQITVDQNLRNYYINNYNYSPDEASQLMGAAALTSALGPNKHAKPDAFVVQRAGINYLVLTSDGIHDYIAKPTFEHIVRDHSLPLAIRAEELIRRAIAGKSSDNLTTLIVELV